LSSTL